jgi:hypothetical protein
MLPRMIRGTLQTLCCLFAMTSASSAETIDGGVARKRARAVRVPEGSIHIDGVLDDRAWSQAVPITDFIQKEPDEGAPPTEDTDVRVVYDDDAIYIGARMYNRGRKPIQAPMGRRDGIEEQAEYLLVSLDTFLDRRTAYAFGVSATGVRMDRFHPQDDEAAFDEDFNPVWQARTDIDEESWTAELWIPFSQLRFNAQAEQVWGMNLQRFAPARNEMVYWSPVPRTEEGWASRFGDLLGIEGLGARKRIEVVPYVGGAATSNGNRDSRNPFDDGRNLTGRLGVDLKMGIGPNLTLDATFNPDFGQVEADPSEVNLTANETFFVEKRPFFTEGARLLNMVQATNFFYSRRIGAIPEAPVEGDFVDYPKETTIIGAAKLTGRLPSGTSVGFLAAVTDQESAHVSDLGSSSTGSVRVAPRTTYGLMRVQQEFGAWGSTAGLMASVVHRDLEAGDPLAALLARNAFGGAADTILRFRNGQYQVRSFAGFTLINGEPEAMAEIQRSPAHYFQRPDRTYWRYDPTRTSMAGFKSGVGVERTGGRHWLWSSDLQMETPGFEANDIGRLSSADGIMLVSSLRYRETVPGKRLRNYSVGLAQTHDWNRAGQRQVGSLRGEVNLTFPNFWTAFLSTGPNSSVLSTTLTRGGPLMGGPGGWTTTATLKNRAAAPTVWTAAATATTDEFGGRMQNVNGTISFRPGNRWQLSLSPAFIRQTDPRQYVTTLGGGRPESYGQRYVFSFIERSTLSTQLRIGYTLKPDINIDLYAEPFAASGRYYDFGELPASRARDLRVYGTGGTTVVLQPDGSRVVTDGASAFTLANQDFNVRSFRSNLVLRWEWRPGSTVYLVWQQDRRASGAVGESAGLGDVFRSLGATGSNYFVVKASFWAPFD